ncbi:MAG: R3H domain-containing nucleic acid-binding protein [Armatimonadota bacterium]
MEDHKKVKLTIEDDLDKMLVIFPPDILENIKKQKDLHLLVEIVMDLGRKPEARFPGSFSYLSTDFVTRNDIQYVLNRVGTFGKDNRAGIERTLHRISAIRNRTGDIIGLTCRVGRAVYGTIDVIRDMVETDKSILLLGRPGVGKTTILRESARVLADELKKRVVVVDTSNEIAGDGDIPHNGIGDARRMQVAEPSYQHAVMIEAVENHMPEVVVVDEIGVEEEAYAARTIAERGVQLIATAHGNVLENLLMNPTLSDLIGGITTVTLSDEEAKKRGTQKTVLERKSPPTFDVVIEIQDKHTFVIHDNVGQVVDLMLRGVSAQPEIRKRKSSGEVEVLQTANAGELTKLSETSTAAYGEVIKDFSKEVRIFPYAVSRNRLDQAIKELKISARIVRHWNDADIILTLKGYDKRETQKMKSLSERVPVFVIKSNTISQIQKFLRNYFNLPSVDMEESAVREAEDGVERAIQNNENVELNPQNTHIRNLQHKVVEKYKLKSQAKGEEPNRRVVIFKKG